MPFPTTIDVEVIDRPHPEYRALAGVWDEYEALVDGGQALARMASSFLTKRPREAESVYQERVKRFTAENHIGTAAAWYNAALFANQPEITHRNVNDKGEATGDIDTERLAFYTRFKKDCDQQGTTYVDFWRGVVDFVVKFGRPWVLVDRPEEVVDAKSKADQRKPENDPYLVLYDPRQVINWAQDERGELEAVVVRTERLSQNVITGKRAEIIRWTIYTKVDFAHYEWEKTKGPKEKKVAKLLTSGPHAMTAVGRVPLRWVQASLHLWLADRAYLTAKDHIDLDNSTSWAMLMNNLALLAHSGSGELKEMVAEATIIELGEDGELKYVEHTGQALASSEERLSRKKDQIYRQVHLMHQARDTAATPSAQSGLSKEFDLLPALNILERFGDMLVKEMTAILAGVDAVMEFDGVEHAVQGFRFQKGDANEPFGNLRSVKELDVRSSRLVKELEKQASRCALPDSPPQIMDEIVGEIEAGPDQEEKRQEAEQARVSEEKKLFSGA